MSCIILELPAETSRASINCSRHDEVPTTIAKLAFLMSLSTVFCKRKYEILFIYFYNRKTLKKYHTGIHWLLEVPFPHIVFAPQNVISYKLQNKIL